MNLHFAEDYSQDLDVFTPTDICSVLEALTGQKCAFQHTTRERPGELPDVVELTRGQLNNLLLWHGYDRVNEDFFRVFFRPKDEALSVTRQAFLTGIHNFRVVALLRWGNIKFGFKRWATASQEQIDEDLLPFEERLPEYYQARGVELLELAPIALSKRPLLGYLTEGKDEQERKSTQETGALNFARYLTYDHMDLYVATSMRDADDFWHVGRLVERLQNHGELADLSLRVYDPTLAYVDGRAAKGLQEALMLLRCRCCVYCAQLSDSFGKDSELASVLAQGKPVIVYAPNEADLQEEFERLPRLCEESGDSVEDILRTKLERVRKSPKEVKAVLKKSREKRLSETMAAEKEVYDKRVATLKKGHPLALQVGIHSGVANGVLLARSADECARLVRQIVLRKMQFIIRSVPKEPGGTFGLYERSTDSLFRISTGDELLMNTFWNFHQEDLTKPSGRRPVAPPGSK